MTTPSLGADPIPADPPSAARKPSAKLGSHLVQTTSPINQASEASVTGRAQASFQAVHGQADAQSAEHCTTAAASCMLASGSDEAAAVFGAIHGGATADTCTPAQRWQAIPASTGCITEARSELGRLVPKDLEPTGERTLFTTTTVQHNDTQSPQQLELVSSTTGVTTTTVGAQGNGPLSISSLLLPDQAFIGSLGLKELEAFSRTCKQAHEHVQAYVDQRCQQLRAANEQSELLEYLGIDCPAGNPTFEQLRRLIEHIDIILKTRHTALVELKVPIPSSKSPFLEYTAEQLVLQLPPGQLQKVLEAVDLCDRYQTFARAANLPDGLTLEAAAERIRIWLKKD